MPELDIIARQTGTSTAALVFSAVRGSVFRPHLISPTPVFPLFQPSVPVPSDPEDTSTLLSPEIEKVLLWFSILHPLRSVFRVRPVARLNRGVELVAFFV